MLAKTARQYIEPRANYHDVLTPSQAKEMGRFLRALCSGAENCQRAGIKPDVYAAMRSWGNVPRTAVEWGITENLKKREKKANRKGGKLNE